MNEAIYSSIDAAVLRELGEGAVSLAADIGRYKSSAVRDIASFHQWSWLENVPVTLSTDSSQTYITIPAYLGGEITIHQDDSGREIRYLEPGEYARLLGASTNTSTKPDYYTIRAGRIEFYMPLATGNSVIVFGTIDTDYVEGTEAIPGIISKMPDIFDSILEWGILRKLDPDVNRKNKYNLLYLNELMIKKSKDGKSKGRAVRGIRDRAVLNSRSYLRG